MSALRGIVEMLEELDCHAFTLHAIDVTYYAARSPEATASQRVDLRLTIIGRTDFEKVSKAIGAKVTERIVHAGQRSWWAESDTETRKLLTGDRSSLWDQVEHARGGVANMRNWSPRRAKEGIAGDESTAVRDDVLIAWGEKPAVCFGSPLVAPPTQTIQVLVWRKPVDAGVVGARFRWCGMSPQVDKRPQESQTRVRLAHLPADQREPVENPAVHRACGFSGFALPAAGSTVTNESRPRGNGNGSLPQLRSLTTGRDGLSMPTRTTGQPTRLGDLLADAMSRADGCADCDNTEPPRAAIPINDGWRCSYLCSSCSSAWTTDYPEGT